MRTGQSKDYPTFQKDKNEMKQQERTNKGKTSFFIWKVDSTALIQKAVDVKADETAFECNCMRMARKTRLNEEYPMIKEAKIRFAHERDKSHTQQGVINSLTWTTYKKIGDVSWHVAGSTILITHQWVVGFLSLLYLFCHSLYLSSSTLSTFSTFFFENATPISGRDIT